MTELDWHFQHHQFHKQMSKCHPQKQQASNENPILFCWPKYNSFTGKVELTGKNGKELLVAVVSPINCISTPLDSYTVD